MREYNRNNAPHTQEVKREIFTVIRCLHCTQHCPHGGDKVPRILQVFSEFLNTALRA